MPETTARPEELPERIEIAPDVLAVKVGRHYVLRFPFNREAVDRLRQYRSAHYDGPSGGWLMDAWRTDAVRRALEEVDRILGPDRHLRQAAASAVPTPRLLVAADSVAVGHLLETETGLVTVVQLGAVFAGAAKLVKSGRAELVGRPVRYAYHRPATEAEIAAEAARREAAAHDAGEPDPEFAA
ncbi:hypothetical protein [Defluviimonas salinarum]|uniref:Uncharacterized protein n=1 Tax=Defluviimonas salinarum TaxID=2992147 RepID=A0ABT3J5G1_9RHOB|nr:hypothetical protein [Defluviimonas salinarum]MCW3782909.1 hypothetical protein [Defluviimonas salinarum]